MSDGAIFCMYPVDEFKRASHICAQGSREALPGGKDRAWVVMVLFRPLSYLLRISQSNFVVIYSLQITRVLGPPHVHLQYGSVGENLQGIRDRGTSNTNSVARANQDIKGGRLQDYK